jgi:hypothetical protein
LEDIENQLKKAADELKDPKDVSPDSGDVNAPVVPDKPAGSPVIPEPVTPAPPPELPVPAPELPPLPAMPDFPAMSEATLAPEEPLVEAPAPQIINDHGTFSTPESAPPMNSIQLSPLEGEPTSVDPFAQPIIQQKVANVEPPATSLGTPEGAAILAADPAPVAAPAQAPLTIPELPPLPPLPPDVSLPPLPPPPPPPPTLGQPPAGAGAVSGDIFGDGTGTDATPPAPTTPPEPGQFKIPGS